jgi:hypothetical protein
LFLIGFIIYEIIKQDIKEHEKIRIYRCYSCRYWLFMFV